MSKILIVDDDDAIREMLRHVLELEGLSVDTAANGAVALQRLENESPPSLILLDLMMPVLDGWEFMAIRQNNERFRSIPVIILSAFTERAQNLDCQEIISKPVELGKLLSTVKQHYGSTQAL